MSNITSPAGQALQQQLREVFLALVELDKHAPHEVTELVSSTVAHIRSWKPLLVAAPNSPEVRRG